MAFAIHGRNQAIRTSPSSPRRLRVACFRRMAGDGTALGFRATPHTQRTGDTGAHAADTRFFAIDYDDFRHIVKTDNRPTAVRKAADTSEHPYPDLGRPQYPRVHYERRHFRCSRLGCCTDRQMGRRSSAPGDSIEGGYQPPMLPALKPWLRIGYTTTSGDNNPNDTTHGTFFQLLPTPRQYARTPFFNMMNLDDLAGTLILRSAPR